MSIADEIVRIENAKGNVKTSIEKRGISVDESIRLDDYSGLIDGFPYITKGTFTPEEDTIVFSVSGLSFEPRLVFADCLAFDENALAAAIDYFLLNKDSYGVVRYRGGDLAKMTTSISLNSTAIEWMDDGLVFTVGQASNPKIFKAGYTYRYIICGGYSL